MLSTLASQQAGLGAHLPSDKDGALLPDGQSAQSAAIILGVHVPDAPKGFQVPDAHPAARRAVQQAPPDRQLLHRLVVAPQRVQAGAGLQVPDLRPHRAVFSERPRRLTALDTTAPEGCTETAQQPGTGKQHSRLSTTARRQQQTSLGQTLWWSVGGLQLVRTSLEKVGRVQDQCDSSFSAFVERDKNSLNRKELFRELEQLENRWRSRP